MDKNALVYHCSISVDRRRYVIATTAAVAALTAIVGTAAVGYGGYQAIKSVTAPKKGGGLLPTAYETMPTPPVGAEASSAEKARIRRKTQTILTSPLKGDEFGTGPTLLGSGDTTKKTVLG